MYATTVDAASTHRIIIRPNRSMSWPQVKLVFACIAAYSLSIAIAFTAMGYWPVLPWAGAELLGLGIGFYVSSRSGRQQETIEVSDERVDIEKTRYGPPLSWSLHRGWARVAVEPPRTRWYPSRLLIRCHGREIPLGDFLAEEERICLAKELTTILSPTRPRVT